MSVDYKQRLTRCAPRHPRGGDSAERSRAAAAVEDAEPVTEAFETGRPAQVDASAVDSREDAIGLVVAMLNDLRKNADAWQNAALDTFLEGLAAAMEDLDQVYAERGEVLPAHPSWRLVAELLVAASAHE